MVLIADTCDTLYGSSELLVYVQWRPLREWSIGDGYSLASFSNVLCVVLGDR